MILIEEQLVKKINSGNAVAIIGAGLSADIGLPTWKDLCYITLNEAKRLDSKQDFHQAEFFIQNNQLLDAFSYIVNRSNKDILFRYLDNYLSEKIIIKSDSLYYEILNWPFKVILTTNFDNAIIKYLDHLNIPFITKYNSQEDFLTYRDTSRDTIFKIHGDFSKPDDIVLTKENYEEFRKSSKREYWRERLNAILQMTDIVIIGYSLDDPDFQDQLERVKKVLLPDQPIFIILPDIPSEKKIELFEKYNIHVIDYHTNSGSHLELGRILRRYSPFIAKRKNKSNIGLPELDPEEVELASNLYTFTQLRLTDNHSPILTNIYKALILEIMCSPKNNCGFLKHELREKLKEKTSSTFDIDLTSLDNAIKSLYDHNLLILDNDNYTITPQGQEKIEIAKHEADQIENLFIKECKISLVNIDQTLTEDETNLIIENVIKGLVVAFKKRGLEISRFAIGGEDIDFSDSTDILQVLNSFGTVFQNTKLHNSFIDLTLHILSRPTIEVKRFLSLISQGYFAYHALGYDQQVLQERFEYITKYNWILDSNIIIYILAKSSNNHGYAKDLIERAQSIGIQFTVTERLLLEVEDHIKWAMKNLLSLPTDSPKFIQAALGSGGEKQNVFAEGYVSWQLDQANPNFSSYLYECIETIEEIDLREKLDSILSRFGIGILHIDDIKNKDKFFYDRDDKFIKQIIDERTVTGTFRGENQCRAESEILALNNTNEYKFLSNSLMLNRVTKSVFVWLPENLYRLLSMLNDIPPSEDLLYTCMLHDFNRSGIQVIDEEAINKIASPFIKQSKLALESQKAEFIRAIGGEKTYRKLMDHYDSLPIEQRPFYSLQFAAYIEREIKQKADSITKREIELKQKEDLTKIREKDAASYAKYLRNKNRKSESRKRSARRRQSQKKTKIS